jgi:hypothetical protein
MGAYAGLTMATSNLIYFPLTVKGSGILSTFLSYPKGNAIAYLSRNTVLFHYGRNSDMAIIRFDSMTSDLIHP